MRRLLPTVPTLFAALALSTASGAFGAASDGLLNYWNFEGNFSDSAGVASGNASTVADDGLPADAAAVTIQDTGPLGKFGRFARSHLIVPNSPDVLAGGESLTISAWFRVAAFNTDWQALIAHGEGSDYRVARRAADSVISYAGGTGDIPGSALGPPINDDAWHHVVAISEAAVSTRLWVDGALVAEGGAPNLVDNGSANLLIGANPQAGGRDWNGDIDDVAMWDRALTDTEIGTIYTSGLAGTPLSGLLVITDSDGDGLPNAWETQYGLNPNSAVGNNGASGDPDADGLTNAVEFNPRGTNPIKDDTDDDGLKDGAELTIHLTNPKAADTDGDSLLDGQEVTGGTNPTKADSDSDGVSDPVEIAEGTSPTVANTGFDFHLVAYWPLDADFNSTVNGHTATAMGTEAIPFVPGKFGNAIQLDGNDQFLQVDGDENVFDFSGGKNLTVSAWFSADAIDTDWQCLIAKGEGNGWRVHRRGADQPPELAFAGGAGDVPKHSIPLSVGDGTMHHVVAISEHLVSERLYLDGVLVASGGPPSLENRANPMRIGSNPDTTPGRFWEGKIDDVAIWDRTLSQSQVQQIYNAGQGKTIQELLGPVLPAQLLFTQVLYNKATDQFTMTWTSSAGKTYTLAYSANLQAFTSTVSTTITSGGATTTFGPFANPSPGATQIYFKAKQN